MCACINSVYLGSKLLFKHVLLKTMERCLLFLILFFQDSLLFFWCRDQDRKGIVPYLLHKYLNSQLKTTLPVMTTKSLVESAWADK